MDKPMINKFSWNTLYRIRPNPSVLMPWYHRNGGRNRFVFNNKAAQLSVLMYVGATPQQSARCLRHKLVSSLSWWKRTGT